MKLIALALVTTIISVEAFSQARPHRRPRPHPRHDDGRVHRPAERRMFCRYSDMFRGRRLIHRFSMDHECRIALRQAVRTGLYCDYSDLYNIRGKLIRRYRSSVQCHARVNLE